MAEDPMPAGIDAAARSVDDDLVPRLAEVVDAVIGVGAALARTAAQATGATAVAAVSDSPLQDMVRFAATTAGNLAGMVVDAARGGRDDAAVRTSRGAPPRSPMPIVTQGSALRIPLLVENTGHTATPQVAFAVTEIKRIDGEDERNDNRNDNRLSASDVTFSPATLVVGPRDFEKLTVRIATSPGTEAGRYLVTVDGANGWFTTAIELAVVAA